MSRFKLLISFIVAVLLGILIGSVWFGSRQLLKSDQQSDVVVFPIIAPCNEEIVSILKLAVSDHRIAYKLHDFNSGGPILELVPGWISIESEEKNIFELHSIVETVLESCYPNVVQDRQFNEQSRVKMQSTPNLEFEYRISIQQGLSRKEFINILPEN